MRPLLIFEGEEAHASHCSASGHVLCPPREMRIRPGRQDQNLESSGPNFYGAAFEQNRKAQKGGRWSSDIPESAGCLGPPGVRAHQAAGRGASPDSCRGSLGPGPPGPKHGISMPARRPHTAPPLPLPVRSQGPRYLSPQLNTSLCLWGGQRLARNQARLELSTALA